MAQNLNSNQAPAPITSSQILKRALRLPTIIALVLSYIIGGVFHLMLLHGQDAIYAYYLAGVVPLIIFGLSVIFAVMSRSISDIMAAAIIVCQFAYYTTLATNLSLGGGTEMSGLLHIIGVPFVLAIGAGLGGLLVWTNKINQKASSTIR